MKLDPQLALDTHPITESGGIRILLHKNALVPWFVLVPLQADKSFRELFELPGDVRENLNNLIDGLSKYLLQTTNSQKINTAALGNVVAQLHIHVIGRHSLDACWPKPVWGNLQNSSSYSPAQLLNIKTDIVDLLDELG